MEITKEQYEKWQKAVKAQEEQKERAEANKEFSSVLRPVKVHVQCTVCGRIEVMNLMLRRQEIQRFNVAQKVQGCKFCPEELSKLPVGLLVQKVLNLLEELRAREPKKKH